MTWEVHAPEDFEEKMGLSRGKLYGCGTLAVLFFF